MPSCSVSLRRLTALWDTKMAAAAVLSMVRQAHQQISCMPGFGQVRSYYVDWRMLRDVKRRRMAFEYADQRLRLNALRKNKILPKELQEVASKEIAALPRDSCPVRIRNRCVLTSRPRGVVWRWRLSRIVFRHLADHAQLSGVQRAIW
nr:small ribosomal subunit protein uS14m [Anolis sagrei ordinatus]